MQGALGIVWGFPFKGEERLSFWKLDSSIVRVQGKGQNNRNNIASLIESMQHMAACGIQSVSPVLQFPRKVSPIQPTPSFVIWGLCLDPGAAPLWDFGRQARRENSSL